MYSLCGFFIVQTMNPMWLDGLLGLPLVIMGIKQDIRIAASEEKPYTTITEAPRIFSERFERIKYTK